ncbi:MAG: aldehyde ferredoxin oxidoreductase family protein [Anaerolineae bacterium]|nr:aldehyde ferredoxin oxidoreductase family protein [Anaerolineae bacterium]
MPGGFHNRVLRINLTTGDISVEEPGEEFFRTYLGGWGMIAHYLLKELPRDADPFGPENLLIFAAGVLTGAPAGGSGRNAVGAKSPLTGGFGESDMGGYWGAELKRAGWDAIIITGKAEKPTYIWIKDGAVELRDAGHLWGCETLEVERTLRSELEEPRLRVAQCGPAGERLARMACIIGDATRAAGRTGLGAVMGSKNLKAVVVRGTSGVEVADKEAVRKIAKWLSDNVRNLWTAGMQDFGTSGGLQYLSTIGGLPTRNFQEGSFEGAEKITGSTMADTILIANDTCYACPVRCKRKVEVKDRFPVTPEYGGPEYETLGAFGSVCGIDDLEAIAYANQLCNAYGLDTISTGMTIAWAMECFERGLLTLEDTDGLELHFGNAEAMLALVKAIVQRKGFGDVLAEGALRAARFIGRDTERYVVHVKGQEFPMHEPRVKFALNLGYIISPTGADHMHNMHDTSFTQSIEGVRSLGILEPLPADYLGPEKVRLFKYEVDWQVFWNCVGLCMFMPYSKLQIRDLVSAVTGWDVSLFELEKVGERALALARVFNAREGFTPADDAPHWRISTPFESGPTAGVKVPAEAMREALLLYYDMCSWDRNTGAPIPAKLHELGVGWAIQ